MMNEKPRWAQDYTGQLENGLRIEKPVTRRAGVKEYIARCERCGRQSYVTQEELSSRDARCIFGTNCKASRTETLRQQHNREQKQAQERQEAVEAEREQRRRETLEAAEAEHRRLNSEILKAVRERILKGRDEDCPRDPDADKLSLTREEAQKYNAKQIQEVQLYRPDIRLSDETVSDALGAYFERNGIRLWSAKAIASAFDRLTEYGIIPKPQARANGPTPVVASQPSPEEIEQPVAEAQPAEETFAVRTFVGRDAQGRPREFTEYEVSRMSPAEYRWAFIFKR